MKNTLTTTLLLLSFSAGLPVSQVLAETETKSQTSQKNTEQSWQEALEAQVALAEAKMLLLQARSELWIVQNRKAALQSLDEANDKLDEGWRSADQVTRNRISELKLQITQAKDLLQQESKDAEAKLRALANRSESALNTALAQAQAKNKELRDRVATRYALVQAKAAALKARVALEINESPEEAEQALKEAEKALQQATETASEAREMQISKLQAQTKAAQKAISDDVSSAKTHLSKLVTSTKSRIDSYDESIRESDEVKSLKKRYAQLEAQAALLKANLAMKMDDTEELATAYLDESKAWYNSLKLQTSQRWDKELSNMSERIDETKQALQEKDKEARTKLADLLEQAAAMLREEDSDK